MLSRWARLCDNLLEAGWLAALIVAPLYFDVYSGRMFEPDKISLVRSLALLMIAVWLCKQIETAPRTRTREALSAWARGNPLVGPALALALVYLISTVWSLAPSTSVWGSYQRSEGLYTTFSYIAIFLIAAASLRTRAQLGRAINTAILVSFPVAWYGLLQHFQLDPLPWAGDATVRVPANMGNPIFFAAYLSMIVPLTLGRWIESLEKLRLRPGRRLGLVFAVNLVLFAAAILDLRLALVLVLALVPLCVLFSRLSGTPLRDSLLAVVYALILAVQLAAILFTQSRGPWIGLAWAVVALLVLLGIVRGTYKLVLVPLGAVAAAIVVVVLLNLPASPLDPLKHVPYLARLSLFAEGEPRVLVWQGSLHAILPHAPLWSPTTGDDSYNGIRSLVGYGPEALFYAYGPFYEPGEAVADGLYSLPDRSHNATIDAWVMTGLLGLAAYLVFFTALFYFGLRWIGVITTDRSGKAFLALWVGGGLATALVVGVGGGWNLVGVALPGGMLLGMFLFLGARAWQRFPVDPGDGDPSRVLWLCVLVAALLGHFVEIQSGIEVVATQVYFWFLAALLVVVGTRAMKESAVEARTELRKPGRAKERRATARPAPIQKTGEGSVLVWSAIAALILATLAYGFISNLAASTGAFDAIVRSLTLKGDQPSLGVLLMFAITWLIAGILGPGGRENIGWDTFFQFGWQSLAMSAAYVVLQMIVLTLPGDPINSFLALVVLYNLALFGAVAIMALALYGRRRAGETAVLVHSKASLLLAPILAVTVAGLVYATNVSGILADIVFTTGMRYAQIGDWDRSLDALTWARTFQPDQDYYARMLGQTYWDQAKALTDPDQRDQALAAGEEMLSQAQELCPLNFDHVASLGRLYRAWADGTESPEDKAGWRQKSLEYLQAAVRMSPKMSPLRNELGQAFLENGNPDRAQAEFELARKLTPAQPAANPASSPSP